MQVHTLALGAYQTNCYIVQNGDRCFLIDPGYEAARILAFLEEKGLTAEAILLTHGHFDHVGAVRELAAELDCKVYIHEGDLALPPQFTAGPLYYTDLYKGGITIEAAGLDVFIRHTPGHTPGSVCLLVENVLFSGDTLFAGSCGRTDLPGGDWNAIHESLRRLMRMPGELTVYPGHGQATTLEHERQYNPYVK
jgi:glyoxylase-like metal-dependent hydrolase (beta-lactamase superfamily II)